MTVRIEFMIAAADQAGCDGRSSVREPTRFSWPGLQAAIVEKDLEYVPIGVNTTGVAMQARSCPCAAQGAFLALAALLRYRHKTLTMRACRTSATPNRLEIMGC